MIALFSGDWHLWDKPPIARDVEADWIAVQAGYLRQVKALQQRHNMAPLFVAGDLFDRWHASCHLANLVIEMLDGMQVFAIPGNHDLPHHNYRDIQRSAYWTLNEAGAIKNLTPGGTHSVGQVTVSPFPHGFAVTPPNSAGNGLTIQVALIHDYLWVEGKGHPGAAEGKRAAAWARRLKGYDVAVFGDNHKGPFLVANPGHCTLYNCGTLIRRHSDEKDNKPGIGLLHSDGSVSRHLLDTKADRFRAIEEEVARAEEALAMDLSEFIAELNVADGERVDFARTVVKWCKGNDVPDMVRTVLLRIIEGIKPGW